MASASLRRTFRPLASAWILTAASRRSLARCDANATRRRLRSSERRYVRPRQAPCTMAAEAFNRRS
eukprot:scaffold651835_cov53-Prasinocladus_malaysianus.AAC.1